MGEIEKRYFLCHNGIGGCWQLCGMVAHVDVETGEVLKIEGNVDHPMNRGRVFCPERVSNMMKLLRHPDQLMYPLKRVGERGENKWQRVSWDQALDEIGEKLKQLIAKHGPECLALTEGTYRSDTYWARTRFLNLIGNPFNEVGSGTQCTCNEVQLHIATAGTFILPDPPNANCIVLQGTGGKESHPANWAAVEVRMKQKPRVKTIAIDPRSTETTRHADIWLQIRPGTDGALYMCWLNIIIREGLYDEEFVKKWSNAPFLVRMDTRRILRESHLKAQGSPEKYAVWDVRSNNIAIWDSETRRFTAGTTDVALKGSCKVRMLDGREVECKPAWQLLTDAVSTYTPEKTAEITWLDAERIEEAARMYATTKPACFHWFAATDQVGRNSTRIEQMRVILRAITGNIDVTGGETLPGVGPMINGKIAFVRGAYLQLDEKCPPEQRRKQIGSDRFKLQLWTEWEVTNRYYEKYHGVKQAMVGHNMQAPYPYLYSGILKGEPYPIKALITWTSDPMVHAPATKTLYKALKSPNLELHVVLEHWMTPAAQLADYVLPIATKLERPYVDCFEDFEAHVWTSEAVVKPMGERRNDYDFWKDLASRLGQGEYFPWRNIEEVVNYRLAPSGLSLKEAARRGIITSPAKTKRYLEVDANTRGPRGFATPTGRVEIYSTVLETLGYDPLPKYEEPPESPVSTPMLAKEYSLILTTGGRFRPLYHGEYRHLGAGFREQHPHPLVDINLDTARELGIADGDWVWIETRRGRIMQKARATPGIHPRVVNVQHNWWYPELPGEEPWLHGVWISNANVLTSDDLETLDELTGGAHYRAMLCKVYKVQSPTMPSK